jgi:hypothetical protein
MKEGTKMKKLTKTQVIAKLKKLNENEVLTVTLFPSKCDPQNTTWVKGFEKELTKQDLSLKYPQTEKTLPYLAECEKTLTHLDSIINDFQYYNCIPELGTRVHFYTN